MMSITTFGRASRIDSIGTRDLPAGNDARLVALVGQRRMRFGERLGADVVETRGLHARLPNSRVNQPRFCDPPVWRASASKNWPITILVAPSSRRPPIAATLPPISAS